MYVYRVVPKIIHNSPHRRDFSLDPHHLQEIPVKLHTFT